MVFGGLIGRGGREATRGDGQVRRAYLGDEDG
jgi:hypothetical protein